MTTQRCGHGSQQRVAPEPREWGLQPWSREHECRVLPRSGDNTQNEGDPSPAAQGKWGSKSPSQRSTAGQTKVTAPSQRLCQQGHPREELAATAGDEPSEAWVGISLCQGPGDSRGENKTEKSRTAGPSRAEGTLKLGSQACPGHRLGRAPGLQSPDTLQGARR